MKVATACVQFAKQVGQVDQALGDQVAHVVGHLPLAVDAQQARSHHLAALLFHEARPDDDVDVVGLVLHGDEDDALRRAWPLAHRDLAAAACSWPSP